MGKESKTTPHGELHFSSVRLHLGKKQFLRVSIRVLFGRLRYAVLTVRECREIIHLHHDHDPSRQFTRIRGAAQLARFPHMTS